MLLIGAIDRVEHGSGPVDMAGNVLEPGLEEAFQSYVRGMLGKDSRAQVL